MDRFILTKAFRARWCRQKLLRLAPGLDVSLAMAFLAHAQPTRMTANRPVPASALYADAMIP